MHIVDSPGNLLLGCTHKLKEVKNFVEFHAYLEN